MKKNLDVMLEEFFRTHPRSYRGKVLSLHERKSLHSVFLETIAGINSSLNYQPEKTIVSKENKSFVFIVNALSYDGQSMHFKVLMNLAKNIVKHNSDAKVFFVDVNEYKYNTTFFIDKINDFFYDRNIALFKVVSGISSAEDITKILDFIESLAPDCIFVPGGMYTSYLFPKIIYGKFPIVYIKTLQSDRPDVSYNIIVEQGYVHNLPENHYNMRREYPDVFYFKELYSCWPFLSQEKVRSSNNIKIITLGRDLKNRMEKNFLFIVSEIIKCHKNIEWCFLGLDINSAELSEFYSLDLYKVACEKEITNLDDFRSFLSGFDILAQPNFVGGAGGVMDAYFFGLEVLCFSPSDCEAILDNDHITYCENYVEYEEKLTEKIDIVIANREKYEKGYYRFLNYTEKLLPKAEREILNIVEIAQSNFFK